VRLETTLRDASGKVVASATSELSLAAQSTQASKQALQVAKPHLWHPDDPYLHRLETRIVTPAGKSVDGFSQRIGIRSVEFRGAEGFFLNGKPFGDKLMGANHHQDFAYVGNAVPNSGQYRDARKLRDAGMRIIRSAHYPQDPAFMDACDELGLFVIVATPGWQFWNNAPSFADRVVSDCQQMVRRDRNHPSVIMWEPILNETGYPADFARRTFDAVHAEYPFPGCYCACDSTSSGAAFYDVLYGGAGGGFGRGTTTGRSGAASGPARRGRGAVAANKSFFTREWGDNVDDWNSHNSDSRVSRGWGEEPMLIQARHYAKPTYNATSYNSFYLTPAQVVGGALWHSFDHQRGYHPDPFWGGIMDVFRQPKYSYYMFMSQRDPLAKHPTADSGPVLFIAHELSVFSGPDITIFTNCDEVRLTIGNQEPLVKKVDHSQPGMPHPPVVFENAYDAQRIKAAARGVRGAGQAGSPVGYKVVAEGLIDGKTVIRTEKSQAKRAEKIVLTLDNNSVPLVADGADFVPVIAEIADVNGNVRRLSEAEIYFSVEGEGAVIGDASTGANPRRVQWGSAPALIRSTLKPGLIRVRARLTFTGPNAPREGVLEFSSLGPAQSLVYSDSPRAASAQPSATQGARSNMSNDEIQRQLRQVEQDQTRFAPTAPQ
jgi:beta-galactosidase